MKLRYRITNAAEDIWLEVERRFLWLVLKILPKGELVDHETCQHKWKVEEVNYQTVSLLLTCYKCQSSGRVDDPNEEEWDRAYGASMKNFEWTDHSRAIWTHQWSE